MAHHPFSDLRVNKNDIVGNRIVSIAGVGNQVVSLKSAPVENKMNVALSIYTGVWIENVTILLVA